MKNSNQKISFAVRLSEFCNTDFPDHNFLSSQSLLRNFPHNRNNQNNRTRKVSLIGLKVKET